MEYQQNGADRAGYGTNFMVSLIINEIDKSSRASDESLNTCISASEISQTLSAKSFSETVSRISSEVPELMGQFKLSWSHYVSLLTLDNPEERSFYEIEAEANSWSVHKKI